jgi:branched-chain amino acid transport system permease protein
MSGMRVNKYWSVAVLALLVLVLPRFVPSYAAFELTFVGAYAIGILGLVILTGTNGQISLGHGAFFGIGGYAVAILAQKLGVPFWASVPLAAIVSGILGLGLGLVALRLEGVYLALATFALAVATPSTLKHFKSLTGGSQGLAVPSLSPPGPLHGVITSEQWLYYVTWVIAGALFLLTSIALGGRLGRALRAIRDNEVAAISFGVNPQRYKTFAFGWSAAYAGIAGAIVAIATGFVSPDTYTVALSLALVTGAVLGGIDTLWGALLGGVIVEFLPLLVQKINPAAPSVVYGIALVLFMIFLPGGIARSIQAVIHPLRLRREIHHARS